MAKYETTVASFASHLHDVNEDKSSMKNIVGTLCFTHDKNITGNLLDKMRRSTAANLPSIFKQAVKNYSIGIPTDYIVTKQDLNYDEIVKAIKDGWRFDKNIEILSAYVGPADVDFFSKGHASLYWGYDEETERLTKSPVNNGINFKYGIGSATFGTNNSVIHRITEYIRGLDVAIDSYDFRIPNGSTFGSPKQGKLYYHVRYRFAGTFGKVIYWSYEVGSGEFPELDGATGTGDNKFMPVIPLRRDNVNLGPKIEDGKYVRDEDGHKITPNNSLYKESKKMLKLYNMDFDDLCLGISQNPSIGDIDYAYLTHAIDIRSKTKEGREYIYQFFNALAEASDVETKVEIRSDFYNISISYDSIKKERKRGSLFQKTELIYSGNNLIIRRKVTDERYYQITVKNPTHYNNVFKGHVIKTTLIDSADEDNYNFMLPLQYNLIREGRSLFAREELLSEALVIVFNCYERRKLKWYEDSGFQIILIVLSIVAIVISWGTLTGPIVAAYQAGIQAMILLAAQYAAVSYAITEALSWLTEELGVDAAILVAVAGVLLIALAPQIAGGSFSSIFTAETALTISSGIAQAVSIISSAGMAELESEMESFTKYAEEQEDLLKALEDELRDATWITPDIITGRKHLFIDGETPEEFFNRTIHAGNVGTLLYEIIPNFVAFKTRLPDIRKTK